MKRKFKKMPPKYKVKGKRKGRRKRPCVDKEFCKYLKDLSDWLVAFHGDYTALRIAVCNLESAVFDGLPGSSAKRFCDGSGPGGDPPPPPAPPKWE